METAPDLERPSMEPLLSGDPKRVGEYRLLGRLGEGGMGQVFLARNRSGRKVALKLLKRDLADNPEFRARFAREVAAARQVSGLHTAQVIDADATADPPWLATAYIEGDSLRRAIRRDGPLSSEALRHLGAGLAEGLAAIHAAGVVHRDLKPGNVIMAADGPRIIDFGISRALDSSTLTQTGMVLGTFAFMAPEQMRADTADAAADVFSLGCLLSYAATGASPFEATTLPAVMHRVLNLEPELSGVPEELRGVVAACLAKDPAARPSTAEVAARLAAADLEPLRVTSVAVAGLDDETAAGRRPRFSRRSLLFGGLAVGGVAAASAVALWSTRAGFVDARGRSSAVSMVVEDGTIEVLRASPDGKTLAGYVYGEREDYVRLWDTATGDTVDQRNVGWKRSAGVGLEYSPDGGTLAAFGEALRVWRADSGEEVGSFATKTSPSDLAFSQDGELVALAGDGGLSICETATGTQTDYLDNSLLTIAFSPDGERFAGVSDLDDLGEVWRRRDGKWVRELEGLAGLPIDGDVRFSPDGGMLAFNSADPDGPSGLTVLDAASGVELFRDTKSVLAADFHPDGSAILAAGGFGLVKRDADGWDVTETYRDEPTGAFALSPDENWLAWVDRDGPDTVRLIPDP